MSVYPAYTVLERVENGLGAGMADVNYVIRQHEGWIETKAVELPKKADTAVLGRKGLRDPEQINWHLKRQVVGCRTFVFVRAKPYHWLVSGAFARDINSWNAALLCERARVWHNGTWKPAHWKRLVETLQMG